MIDEKKELEEYTCAIGAGMPKRLTYLNLTNKLAGVKRALIIIARHCLFDRNLDEDRTIEVLKSWCGFKASLPAAITDEDKGFLARIDSWLPGYINRMVDDGKADALKQKQLLQTDELLATKKEAWDYDPFFNDGKRNDKNAVTFAAIAAEAVNEGPLKSRVLTFTKSPYEAIVLPKKGAQGGKKKLFIMSIAAYCAKVKPGKRKIHLDQPAFSNWVGEGCPSGKKVKEMLEGLSFKCGAGEEKLFSFENVGNESVNYYKMLLNDDFVQEYRPRLMTVDEFLAIPKAERAKLCTFADRGCNVIMQEVKL